MSARTTTAVEVTDLHITRAKNHILHGLTFTLDKGSITGLLGPSGCGKTTLIRAIVGSQRITSGTITILGQPAGSTQLRTTVAYATQNLSIYRDLTVMANITYFARLYGATDYDNVLETVGLTDYRTTLVENLSGGQASRVSLACALVAQPQVLILDEPTVGLDPVTRKSLWEVFRQLADTGITIMVSSHVLDEANHCDNVILMRRGRILAHAPINTINLMVSYAIVFGMLGLIQASILCFMVLGPFNIDIAGPWPMLLVIALLDAFLGVSLGLFASALARSEFQAVQFMPVFIAPQLLLCGLFIPLEMMPNILETIARALPMTWAVEVVRTITTTDTLDASVWRHIGELIILIIVALYASSLTMRRTTK